MNRPSHIVSVALALLLAACGGSTPSSSGGSKRAPKTSAAAAAAANADGGTSGADAVATEEITYQYNPVAKRDPFRAPVVDVGGAKNELCNEPLCQFELDQLTLVGVVTGIANPFAMVEDPQGKGYIIRRNTRMGRQGGKVTQILRDSVTVTEFFISPDGKQNPNPISMQLKPDRTRAPEQDLGSSKTY